MTEQLTDRELDAWIAEHVMGLRVVAHDWPCGYSPDGAGYEATSFPNDPNPGSWFCDHGPVYVPEGADWPPQANTEDNELAELLGGVQAWVEPVAFYSSDWGAAGRVMDHFAAQRRYLWLSYEAKNYLTGPDHMVWRASFAAPQEFHVTADSAPRAIALAAKRYTKIMSAANP
jgi:hypothetical protein